MLPSFNSIEHSHQSTKTPPRPNPLGGIKRIIRLLSTSQDIELDIHTVLNWVCDLFEATYCMVDTYQDGDKQLSTQAQVNRGHYQTDGITTLKGALVHHVLATQQPIFCAAGDAGNIAPSLQKILQNSPLGCWLSVPLMVRNSLLGTLTIAANQPQRRFNTDDLVMVEIIAAQLAANISNQRLLHKAQHHTREMITLAEVGREISMMFDLGMVLERMAVRATDLLPHADMALYLRKSGSQKLYANVVVSKHTALIKAHPITMGEGIVGSVAQSWGAEIINYPEGDPRGSMIPGKPKVEDEPEVMICSVLVSKGEVAGVIVLWQPRRAGLFQKADLNFLIGISQQMVIAIENDQLYQEIRREKQLFEALFLNSPVATVMVDFRDDVITAWNPTAENLFGFSVEEAIGQDIHALLKHKFTQFGRQKHYEILSDEQETRTVIQRRRKDGTLVYVELLAVPVVIDGERVTDLVLYHDVTELERARKEVEYINAALSEVNSDLQVMAERMQDELNTAHQIQKRLLPFSKPDWHDLDMVCYSAPAREVGGDLYAYHAITSGNYHSHGANKYLVAVGDVSGKGMPAALLMAVSMASFQAMVGQGLSPGILLTRLDKAIARFTKQTRQNCALIYAEITPPHFRPVNEEDDSTEIFTHGHLRVANAGCIAPYIKRATGILESIDVSGIPLGVGLGAEYGYREKTVKLYKGDLVIFTSDGVVEANNKFNEMFGFERLEKSIADGPPSSAEAMLIHLQQAVYQFAAWRELHDDLTIVVAQV